MAVLPSTSADEVLYHSFSADYFTKGADPYYNSHNWNFHAAFVEGLIDKNRELPVQTETGNSASVAMPERVSEPQQMLLK